MYSISRRNDILIRSVRASTHRISLYKQLCLKEYLFLFKYERNILFSSVIFPIIFIFIDQKSSSPLFYILLFIFQFSLNYGFNYLGIEKKNLIAVLILSNSFHMLVRVKILFFLWGSLLGSAFIVFIYSFFFHEAFLQISLSSLIMNIVISSSFFCLLSHWNSINNYSFTFRQTIYKFMSGFLVFIILTIMNELIFYLPQFKNIYYLGCIFIGTVCIYFSIIDVDYFSNRLKTQTKLILKNITISH